MRRLSIFDLSSGSHSIFLCIEDCDVQVLEIVQVAGVDLAQNLRSRLGATGYCKFAAAREPEPTLDHSLESDLAKVYLCQACKAKWLIRIVQLRIALDWIYVLAHGLLWSQV